MISILAFVSGCMCGVAWSAAQAVEYDDVRALPEPDREEASPVSVVIVASDGSPVSSTIDAASGGLGFSHVYLDIGHYWPDGRRLIVDYQPGAGVHYCTDEAYRARGKAVVVLEGDLGAQVWGCVRSKLGQPFNAAGVLMGRATLATCSGLVYGCMPPEIRDRLYTSGRPIAPNDLAAAFGAELGKTVRFRRERA